MTEDHRELFEEFFDRYYKRVYSFFVRQGFSTGEAEELTQDTFARVFESMDTYRGGSELAYLMTVTKNVWKNELRRRGAIKRGDPPLSLDDSDQRLDERRETSLFGAGPSSPEEESLRNERLEAILSAIRALPPRMRRALVLRIQGLTYREISVAMNITIDGVKKLLYEARRRLKQALGSWISASLDEVLGEDDE